MRVELVLEVAAYVLVGLTVLLSVRRALWVVAAWRYRSPPADSAPTPDVLIAIAFCNEERSLPELLSKIDALTYPIDRLSVCLADDGSRDGGTAVARRWVGARAGSGAGSPAGSQLVILSNNVGKAEALNRAVAAATRTPDVVVVYDADQRPHADSLRRLVAPFADPKVDAVSGYRRPAAPTYNLVSAYACLEAWTHQLVSLAGKDAMGLNPPTMGGNCAYRRSALARIGGFPVGALSEDIEVSLAIAGSGKTTRFASDAIADHDVAASLRQFLGQRRRWSQGLLMSGRHIRGLESAFVATGYLDRVVLLLVVVFAIAGVVGPWWIVAYVVPALAAVATAVARARPSPDLACLVVAAAPVMFVVDVVASVLGGAQGLWRRQRSVDGPHART